MKCRRCESDGPFSPSYIVRHNHLCKRCASEMIKEKRKKDPLLHLTHQTYNAFRRHKRPMRINRQVIQRILDRCGNKSVIGGEDDLTKLRIVPIEEPATELNCVLLTKEEARTYPKYKDFPQEVRYEIKRRTLEHRLQEEEEEG